MPEHIWKRQCSEDEDSLASETKSNMQKHKQKPRPKSAPLPNYDELLEKLKVTTLFIILIINLSFHLDDLGIGGLPEGDDDCSG